MNAEQFIAHKYFLHGKHIFFNQNHLGPFYVYVYVYI